MAGYDSQNDEGVILLADLQDSPRRIEILSSTRGSFDPEEIYYQSSSNRLFVYDTAGDAIIYVFYSATNNQLPGSGSFTTILHVAQLPILRYARILMDEPRDGESTGLDLVDADLISSAERYYLDDSSGTWQLSPRFELPAWIPVGPFFPSQGPLIAVVAGASYLIKRLDLLGVPEVVASGDFGEDTPIGQMVSLNIPSGGFVPGASYFIEHVEDADLQFPTAYSSRKFTPLLRYGKPLEGANMRFGQGLAVGRSEFGNSEYMTGVYADWVDTPQEDETFSLVLWWALKDENGQEPVMGIGEHAILTNPLGAIVKNITLGPSRGLSGYIHTPLTDSRLIEGDLVYFQYAMAVDNSTVVISDVFATTVFGQGTGEALGQGSGNLAPVMAESKNSFSLGFMSVDDDALWQKAVYGLREAGKRN